MGDDTIFIITLVILLLVIIGYLILGRDDTIRLEIGESLPAVMRSVCWESKHARERWDALENNTAFTALCAAYQSTLDASRALQNDPSLSIEPMLVSECDATADAILKSLANLTLALYRIRFASMIDSVMLAFDNAV